MGTCVCNELYTGRDCHHYRCLSDECAGADDCHDPAEGSAHSECGGNGACVAGSCVCETPFTAISECTRRGCPGDGLCSGRGVCRDGVCACAPGAYGEDCEIDLCSESRALRPGIHVEFFNEVNFNIPLGSLVWQQVAFRADSGFPYMGRDDSSFIMSGLLRLQGSSGIYKFRCNDRHRTGQGWIDGRLVTDSQPLHLNASTSYRFKLEVNHYSSEPYIYFDMAGPYDTVEAAAQAGNNDWVLVPATSFVHEVRCPDGCSNRGCCVADGQCSCEPGFGGHDCSLDLSTCGDDAPRGGLEAGGLRARYYSSRDFAAENLVVEQIDDRVNLGSLPPGVPTDTFSVRWIGRLQPIQTGWHVIGVSSNDRSRVRVILGGVNLFRWTEGWTTSVFLDKDQSYSLEVEMRKVERFSTSVDLFWSGPGFDQQTIPARQLQHYKEGFACGCGPQDCTNAVHGSCLNANCLCEPVFEGTQCENYKCRTDSCFGHDDCHRPDLPWGGSATADCSGRGQCVAGVCDCEDGFSSLSQCERTGCPGSELEEPGAVCSGHGACDGDLCVCDDGYHGEDCAYTMCAAVDATLPGVHVTYFSDYNLNDRVATEVRDEINRGSNNELFPGTGRDSTSASYEGRIHAFASGFYRLRCPHNDGECHVFINGTEVSSATAVHLSSTAFVPFRLVRQHDDREDWHRMEWSGPHASAVEAESDPTPSFEVVPAQHFSHTATCPDGCGEHGCCVTDGYCRCDFGWTGQNCTTELRNCGPEDGTVDGFSIRIFNDRAFESLGLLTHYNELDRYWYREPAPGIVENGWSIDATAFYVPLVTGWHTFWIDARYGSIRLLLGGRVVIPLTGGFRTKMYLYAGVRTSLVMQYIDDNSSFGGFYVYSQAPNQHKEVIDFRSALYGAGQCACAPCEPQTINDFAPEFIDDSLAELTLREDQSSSTKSVRTLRARDQDTGASPGWGGGGERERERGWVACCRLTAVVFFSSSSVA